MPLRLIDAAYLSWQGAAKRFGLMDPDEPGVRCDVRPDGPWLIFDRDPDDGWPALKLRMPPDSRPIRAVCGICSRGALWACDASRDESVAFLCRELDRQGIDFDQRRRKRHVALDAAPLRAKVWEARAGSRVAIMQRRSGQSVEAPLASGEYQEA